MTSASFRPGCESQPQPIIKTAVRRCFMGCLQYGVGFSNPCSRAENTLQLAAPDRLSFQPFTRSK